MRDLMDDREQFKRELKNLTMVPTLLNILIILLGVVFMISKIIDCSVQ